MKPNETSQSSLSVRGSSSFLKSLLTAIACLTLVATVAVGADPVYKTYFGSKAINGYDAVAYHLTKQAVKGTKQHAHNWKGANWYFSSAANLAKFKEAPEKYAPQFGGWCAWAISEADKLVKTNPSVFDLYEGKLYLNYSKDTQSKWRADMARMIKRGNITYPRLITK